MARYPNGQIPDSALHRFNAGRTVHWKNGRQIIEDWYWALTPGTYRKHLALVALAKRNTGRNLQLSSGFSCYRPLYGQVIARTLHGNGAATVGTSSHGGVWEGRDTLAMDYHNWASVYDGNRARWFADVRAVGLTPDMISPRRGYPDEPWHVIDFEPWRAVPAGGGATPFPLPEAEPEPIKKEDDMPGIKMHHQVFTNGNQAFVVETDTGFFIPDYNHRMALAKAYEINLDKLPWVNEYDWNAVVQAKTYNNSGYPQATSVALSDAQVKTIAAAAAAAVSSVTPGIDQEKIAAIAAEVEGRLLDNFAAIPDAVNDNAADRLKD